MDFDAFCFFIYMHSFTFTVIIILYISERTEFTVKKVPFIFISCFYFIFIKWIPMSVKKRSSQSLQFWFFLTTIAESFYNLNYGLSLIMSKFCQIISVMKIHKDWCFQRNDISKIVHFGALIQGLSWRQQKHQFFCFHYWDYFTNFNAIIDDL